MKLLQAILTQFLFVKVMTSYIQPYSVKPYNPREPVQNQQKPYITEYKGHYQQPYAQNYAYPTYQRPEPVVTSVVPPVVNPPVSTPVLNQPRASHLDVANIKAIAIPDHLESISKKSPANLDAQVLNNLAIALQLLIVNNIISNPPPELQQCPSPLTETILEMSYPANSKFNLNTQEMNFQMPNTKFLGSSNFGNDLMPKSMLGLNTLGSSSGNSPRSGITLMSPYDAIANSSPLSESLTSAYLSKKDFQSPYAAIMAADNNKDLFSMNDFF